MASIKSALKLATTFGEELLEFFEPIFNKEVRELKNTAEFIADEAEKRSPVLTGRLEKNIRVQKVRRRIYEVVMDVRSDDGFAYGAYLHENRDWQLGPKSRAKQAGQSERIGPKFLERAFTENKDLILEKFKEAIVLKIK